MRYSRQTQLAGFGLEAQQKLKQAKVLVVGAGGLGVPVLQYLTGMGVGVIGIADGDIISLSNLHRQILYSEVEVGEKKVFAAINKLKALNSETHYDVFSESITNKNALKILADFDVIIDASDNFSTRYLLNDACVILKKPLIYGAVQQFEGHVSVFNYQNGPTYRCLYPAQPYANEIPDCNTIGVLGVAPGIVGCHQALQVVKVITGVGQTLSGYLQVFDFLNDSEYKIKLKAKPENKLITSLTNYSIETDNEEFLLTVEELHDWYKTGKQFQLIDVREKNEFDDEHLEHAQSVPWSVFEPNKVKMQQYLPLVLFCEKGIRSNEAITKIKKEYPAALCYSVLGGLSYWRNEFQDEYLVNDKSPAL